MADTYRVPALTSAAKILEAISHVDGKGARPIDLVRITGIPKSTMHHLLATLESERYVARDGNGRYRLGPALVTLGAIASAQRRAISIATERIAPLAAEWELSFAVVQRLRGPRGGMAEVIDRAYPRGVHVGITIGSRYGAFDGALGKCLLACLDPKDAERIIGRARLVPRTGRTITDREAMLAEVEAVRARGWGASLGEYNSNNAVAAPIFDAESTLDLLLLALGFSDQMDEQVLPQVGRMLAELGQAITTESGGRVPDEWQALSGTRVPTSERSADVRSI